MKSLLDLFEDYEIEQLNAAADGESLLKHAPALAIKLADLDLYLEDVKPLVKKLIKTGDDQIIPPEIIRENYDHVSRRRPRKIDKNYFDDEKTFASRYYYAEGRYLARYKLKVNAMKFSRLPMPKEIKTDSKGRITDVATDIKIDPVTANALLARVKKLRPNSFVEFNPDTWDKKEMLIALVNKFLREPKEGKHSGKFVLKALYPPSEDEPSTTTIMEGKTKAWYREYTIPPMENALDVVAFIIAKILDYSHYQYLGKLFLQSVQINVAPVMKFSDLSMLKLYGTAVELINGICMDQNIEGLDDCVPRMFYKIYALDGLPAKQNRDRKNLSMRELLGYLANLRNPAGEFVFAPPEREEELMQAGYTIEDIIRCAKEIGVPGVYVMDEKRNFILQESWEPKGRKLAALNILVFAQHAYIVTDTDWRWKMMNATKASALRTASKKVERKVPSVTAVDPCLETLDSKDGNIVSTDPKNAVHKYWTKLITLGKFCVNANCHDSKVISFTDHLGNRITHRPDYRDVLVVQAKYPHLDSTKSLHRMALEHINNCVPRYESALNPWMMDMIVRRQLKNRWHRYRSTEPTEPLKAIDISKAYTSFLTRYMVELKEEFPIFNPFAEPKRWTPEDGILKGHYYYVEPTGRADYSYCATAEFFPSCLVREWLLNGDCKQPTMVIAPERTLPADTFVAPINDIINDFPNFKDVVNRVIGCLGQKNKPTRHTEYAGTPLECLKKMANDAALIPTPVQEFSVVSDSVEGDPLMEYKYLNEYYRNTLFRLTKEENHRPLITATVIHDWVLAVGACITQKIRRAIEAKGGVVYAEQTDCIIYSGCEMELDPQKIGGTRVPKSFSLENTPVWAPPKYVAPQQPSLEWKDADWKTCIDARQSLMITGGPGTGKSYTCRLLRRYLESKGIKYAIASPTHKALAQLYDPECKITPQTVYKLLGLTPGDFKSSRLMKYVYVIIDEASMVHTNIWAILGSQTHMKFVIIGDFNQLPPVEDSVSNVRKVNSTFMKMLCDCNRQVLQTQHRFDAKMGTLLKAVLAGEVPELEPRECDRAIVYTNQCRQWFNRLVNDEWGEYPKIGGWYVHPGMPLMAICKRPEKERFNNEGFEVVTKIDSKNVHLKSTDRESDIVVKPSELWTKMEPAYAITTHKAQGMSINYHYEIFEHQYMSKAMLYTALSRATSADLVHWGEYKHERKGLIYRLTCKETKKSYIGCTLKTAAARWAEHCKKAADGERKKLYEDVRKYGKSAFVVEVLEEGILQPHLKEREQYWISKENTISAGYNKATHV